MTAMHIRFDTLESIHVMTIPRLSPPWGFSQMTNVYASVSQGHCTQATLAQCKAFALFHLFLFQTHRFLRNTWPNEFPP